MQIRSIDCEEKWCASTTPNHTPTHNIWASTVHEIQQCTDRQTDRQTHNIVITESLLEQSSGETKTTLSSARTLVVIKGGCITYGMQSVSKLSVKNIRVSRKISRYQEKISEYQEKYQGIRKKYQSIKKNIGYQEKYQSIKEKYQGIRKNIRVSEENIRISRKKYQCVRGKYQVISYQEKYQGVRGTYQGIDNLYQPWAAIQSN